MEDDKSCSACPNEQHYAFDIDSMTTDQHDSMTTNQHYRMTTDQHDNMTFLVPSCCQMTFEIFFNEKSVFTKNTEFRIQTF